MDDRVEPSLKSASRANKIPIINGFALGYVSRCCRDHIKVFVEKGESQ
jgi:hypothetical protein